MNRSTRSLLSKGAAPSRTTPRHGPHTATRVGRGIVLALIVLAWATPAGASTHAHASLRCHDGHVRVWTTYTTPADVHPGALTVTVTWHGKSTVILDHVHSSGSLQWAILDLPTVKARGVSVSWVTRADSIVWNLPPKTC